MLCSGSPGQPRSSQRTHLPMSPYTLEGGIKDITRQGDGEKIAEHGERQEPNERRRKQ